MSEDEARYRELTKNNPRMAQTRTVRSEAEIGVGIVGGLQRASEPAALPQRRHQVAVTTWTLSDIETLAFSAAVAIMMVLA